MFESNLLSQINTASPLPTFVEVDLVNSINKSMSKAFQFAHLLLAERSNIVASVLPWTNEIWVVLQTLLEHRLLFHANTTFAEMMFGLRRGVIASPTRPLASQGKLSWWVCGPAPMPSPEEQALCGTPVAGIYDHLTAAEVAAARGASYGHLRFRPLSNTQRYITLLLITLRPYLKQRIAMWYAQQTDSSPGVESMSTAYAHRYPMRDRVKQLLLRLYPIVHTLLESLNFLYQILFLLELTPYTMLHHRLFGIVVRRLTGADHIAANNPRAQRALTLARVVLVVMFVGFRLLDLTRAGNGGGSTSANIAGAEGEDLAVPQPPVWGVDVRVPPGAPEPQPGVCPVCERRVTNAAVCTVSGVVGCYPCLQGYAKEHGTCPVTRHKAPVECIRRIYEC